VITSARGAVAQPFRKAAISSNAHAIVVRNNFI
jgi:hypothetical protein